MRYWSLHAKSDLYGYLTYTQILNILQKKNIPTLFYQSGDFGGRTKFPNKLRISFCDESYLDVWLSSDGDYSYRWERRAKDGTIYRWDNAPDHPDLATFPKHFHDGSQENVVTDDISVDYKVAIRDVLSSVRQSLSKTD